MSDQNVFLDTKVVDNISGKYVIKSYQRGYRWDIQVKTLLDDLWENGGKDYCLQPIVVRKENNTYELIDGQQRLTTLYLLLKYIKANYKPRINLKFSIKYENRDKSEIFLTDIKKELSNDNIDFFFIYNAYEEIDKWFLQDEDEGVFRADEMYRYLHEFVKVIWYEVDESTDPIALFTRLNIGRIPLTNSELIKALFLNRNKEINKYKQIEIALQWDDIERQMGNKQLWYFLTNKNQEEYSTKIDLLFEFMADQELNSKEKYATFFYFDKEKKKLLQNGDDEASLKLWDNVKRTYLLIKEWFENHTLYHKIGYIVASETMSIKQLIALSKGKTKSDFVGILNQTIADSIKIKDDESYMDLSYLNKNEQIMITKILLLFNVQSVCNNGSKQRFPFDEYKEANWSLEHIHAQQSEGLNVKDAQKEWLKQHVESLKAINDNNRLDDLINRTENAKNDKDLTTITFNTLFQEIFSALTDDEDKQASGESRSSYMHSLTNMALLKVSDNAALSNAVFDAKRNLIIEMDKQGQFIPFCTRMVFLKYYSPSKGNQIHFWSNSDRKAYRENMNEVLKTYLEINGKEI
jgi:uncharacterized protein with ParB-like and HNH nuclease domain